MLHTMTLTVVAKYANGGQHTVTVDYEDSPGILLALDRAAKVAYGDALKRPAPWEEITITLGHKPAKPD